jgi:hypothetical protein
LVPFHNAAIVYRDAKAIAIDARWPVFPYLAGQRLEKLLVDGDRRTQRIAQLLLGLSFPETALNDPLDQGLVPILGAQISQVLLPLGVISPCGNGNDCNHGENRDYDAYRLEYSGGEVDGQADHDCEHQQCAFRLG